MKKKRQRKSEVYFGKNTEIYSKKTSLLRCVILITILLIIASCRGFESSAPVVQGWHKNSRTPQHNYYVVQKGDSLYSIAWAFDLNFHDLAKENKLKPPYKLHPGEHLDMTISSRKFIDSTPKQHIKNYKANKNIKLKSYRELKSIKRTPIYTNNDLAQNIPFTKLRWHRPTEGKVIKPFSLQEQNTNKGIDISGKFGAPIYASAAGKIVYCGTGLKGLGKLIIIKHDESFLSAYAHNDTILVKEGETVTPQKKIATIGKNNAGTTLLHFEIRYNGKPVNPAHFIDQF